MSFNDDFLNRQADPNRLDAVVQRQGAALRQVGQSFVRVQSLDEIADEIGALQFKAVDPSGQLRMIMSAINLLEELGVSAHLAGVDANGIVQFWLNADDGKLNFTAEEFPSITPIEWVADNDGEIVAKVLGWYVDAVASGAYLIGRGKDASHRGVVGLAVVPSTDTDYSTALIFQIDSNGSATLNLKSAAQDNVGEQSLVIQTNVAENNQKNAMLYLDTYTKGTPAAGLGTALAFRAEDTNGDMEEIGYISAVYMDPTHGTERSIMTMGVIAGSGAFKASRLPAAGWQPYAMMDGASNLENFSASSAALTPALALAIPISINAPMMLRSVSVWNNDASLQRTWNWALYDQRTNSGNSDENTLYKLVEGSAAETFTATVASLRTITAAGAPYYIGPGLWWLVLQNQHASNNFSLGRVLPTTVLGNMSQTKTVANPLTSTLDFVAATWIRGTSIFGVRLNGDVFGQTSAF